MVAIIASAALGLEQSSAGVLGGRGLLGSAAQGRGADLVYVNAATGNLIVQKRDELLIGRGPDVAALRVYNSQGLLNDDNGDNWRTSAQRSVALSGTINAAASTVTLTGWDGATTLFTFDTATQKYVSAAGGGAVDTVVFMATSTISGVADNSWVFTDGSTQLVDAFDGASGKIAKSLDPDGNALSYAYGSNGFVSQVETANGESTFYDYTGNNLTQIRTVVGSTTTTRVRYGYDGSNRLSAVTVDLSPEDNSILTGSTYVTTYTYDGASKRVASISQSDGSSLAIAYDTSGRVLELVQTVSTGVTRTTTFSYNASSKSTTITDPIGQQTVLYYDDADAPGQLSRIVGPAIGGVSQDIRFDYNARGDVISTTDAQGHVRAYGYDANGNVIYERDSLGNTITRTYGARNELLAETRYASVDPVGVSAPPDPPSLPPAPPPPPPPPPSGLVAGYALNEGTGASISNIVGSSYTGTFGGTPTWSAEGQNGYAIAFGSNDQVDLGDITEINGASAVTIEAWMKRDAANSRVLLGKDSTGGMLEIKMSDDGTLNFGLGNGPSWTGGGAGQLNDANWHHIALVFDGTQTGNANRLKAYVDGQAVTLTYTGTIPSTTTTDTTSFKLGRILSYYSAGMIDDVRIYNRALTQGEVQADMAAPVANPPPPPPSGIIGAYNLDEGAGLTANNAVSSNYNGTFGGTPVWSSSGQHSGAISFGANDQVELGDIAEINGASAVTIEAWMKRDAANSRVFLGKDSTGGMLEIKMSDDGTLNFGLGNGPSWTGGGAGQLNDTNWHHIALVFDGTQTGNANRLKAYVDGQEVTLTFAGTIPSTTTTDTTPFRLGRILSYYSAGMIDDVRIYNRALTQAEVQSDMIVPVAPLPPPPPPPPPPPGSTTGLVGAYALNEGAGTVVANGVSTNYAGTFGGTPTWVSGGQHAGAIQFGASDQVDLGDITEINGASAVTIEAWMKRDAANSRVFIGKESSAGMLEIKLSDDGTLNFGLGNGPSWSGGGAGLLNDTNWHHIALVFDGTQTGNAGRLKAYVDGQAVALTYTGTIPSTTTTDTTPFRLGRIASYYSAGTIDDVRIYSRALTQSEVQADMVNPAPEAAAPPPPTGRYGSALIFDAGDYVRVDNLTQLAGASAATIEAWMKRPAPGEAVRIGKGEAAAENLSMELRNDGTLTVSASAGSNVFGTIALNDSDWHHIVLVFDGTQTGNANRLKAYVDGVLQTLTFSGTVGATTSANTDPLRIGRAIGNTSNNGYIDEVRLYARALSQTEIIADRDTPISIAAGQSGIIAAYGFNEGAGTSAANAVSSIYPGVFVGTPEWTATLTGVMTSRFVYDSENHLEFVISAEGRVTEYEYDAYGQQTAAIEYANQNFNVLGLAPSQTLSLAALTAWAGAIADKSGNLRTETVYDGRGAIQEVKHYGRTNTDGSGYTGSGAEITKTLYVYDPSGNLLQRRLIDSSGPAETYVYDGMGRLTMSTDLDNATTSIVFQDGTLKTVTTLANGLVQTKQYNKAGELISVTETTGSTTLSSTIFAYDALGRLRYGDDATGVRTHWLYDAVGRKVAEIGADGSMTRFIYNLNNQLVATVRYKNALSSGQLSSLVSAGVPQNVTLASVLPTTDATGDRWEWRIYDASGALSQTIDAQGAATSYLYDGAGRLTTTTQHAILIAGATVTGFKTTPPSAAQSIASDAANDRVTRYFYDDEGLLIGALDAEGGFTQTVYDRAGQKTKTIAYANPTPSGLRAAGSFSELLAAATSSSIAQQVRAQDIHNYFLYDGRGLLRVVVDGEGAITRYAYNNYGDLAEEERGRKLDPAQLLIGPPTLSMAASAPGATLELTTYARSAYGQVLSRTISLTGGATETSTFAYDAMRRLVKETTADGRVIQRLYDLQGRVTGELTGEGSEALAALGASPTQIQIDNIYATYGVRHTYDAAGRLVSSLAANGVDAQGARTRYYYDADGNLRFVINALGEVKEFRFNIFAQQSEEIDYGTRLSPSVLATLSGGLVTSDITTKVAAIADVAKDSKRSADYNVTGSVASIYDALGYKTDVAYNSFGQETSCTAPIADGVNVVTTRAYDRRGLLTSTILDSAGGLALTAATVYDAFGRAITTTDARGVERRVEYDRAGRIIVMTDGLGASERMSYDSRSNLVALTDKRGYTTTYAYTAFNRAITTTTAEGLQTIVVNNEHGQTVSVTDPRGVVTTYGYDKDGAVESIIRTSGGVSETVTSTYDAAGRLYEATDRRGVKTRYTYDAVHRVLSQIVDAGPGGMALTTQYEYDPKGQIVKTTDPSGVVTQFSYDLEGRQISIAVDPAGINAVTSFAYDRSGRVLTQTEGAKVTQFTYDKAGRLTKTQVDPAGLNITTQFTYDGADNAVAKTDANGNVTRFVYDAENRLTYTVDALGGVMKVEYDAAGNVIAQSAYANAISLTSPSVLALAIGASDVTSRLSTSGSNDRKSINAYDKDGRQRYAVDALGFVTEFIYDAAGTLVRGVAYKNAITPPSFSQVIADNAASASSTYDGTYFGSSGGLPTRTTAGRHGGGLVFGSGDYVRIDDVAEIKGQTAVTIGAWMKRAAPGEAVRLGKAESASDNLSIELRNDGTLTVGANAGGAGGYGSVALNDDQWHYIVLVFDGSQSGNAGRLKAYVDGVQQTLSFTGTIGTTTTTQAQPIRIGRVQGNTSNGMIDEVRIYGRALSAAEIATDRDTPISVSAGASGIVAALGFNEGSNEIALIQAALAAAGGATSDDHTSRAVRDGFGREAFTIDTSGAVTGRSFDAAGNVIKETRYSTLYTPATQPNLADMQSWANGRTTEQKAADRATLYFYDNAGRLAYVADPEAYITERRYNEAGRLEREIQYKARYTGIDASDTYTSVKAELPSTIPVDAVEHEYRYDAAGRLFESVDSLGVITRLALDAQGRITDRITAYGLSEASTTHFEYDAAGRATAERAAYGTAIEASTLYEYDGLGNKVRVVDANNSDAFFYYDKLGRIELAIDQERYATATAYTFSGQIASIMRHSAKVTGTVSISVRPAPAVDPSDAQTEFSYDKLDRLTRITDAEDNYEQYTLNAFGDRVSVRNKLGGVTQYTFDKSGRILTETLPVKSYSKEGQASATNIVNSYTYNAFGNRTRMTEAVGFAEERVTDFEYDAAGRLVRTIGEAVEVTASATAATAAAAQPVEHLFYDRRGNVIEKRDATGAKTFYWYDELNRVTHVVSPTGALVGYSYDANGNVLETRAYATKITPPADATGLAPAGTTSADDRITEYGYDKLGRLKTVEIPNITTAALDGAFAVSTGALVTSYEYNKTGQVVKTTNANEAVSYAYYDKLGRKIAEIDAVGYRTDWAHDAEGNVKSETRYATASTLPSGVTANPPTPPGVSARDRVTTFDYDRMGRRTSEKRAGVAVFGEIDPVISEIKYTYNALGQVKTKEEATGDTTTYNYDSAGRLVEERRQTFIDFSGWQATPKTNFYYDGLGNLSRTRATGDYLWLNPATQAWETPPDGNTLQRVTTYTYDAAGRLAASTEAAGTTPGQYDEEFVRTYRYDAAGRVTREEYYRRAPDGPDPDTLDDLKHEAVGYEYDAEGRAVKQCIVVDVGGVWRRDLVGANGGLTIDTAMMKYNAFGEVVERGVNDVYAEKFAYDGAGRLWRSNVGNGLWKYFMYDKAGNQTLIVSSVGLDIANQSLTWVLDRWGSDRSKIAIDPVNDSVVATITKYNKRNEAIEVLEPKRETGAGREDIVTTRGYNAFGEVASETDALGHTFTYAYNTMGRLVKIVSPAVEGVASNGLWITAYGGDFKPQGTSSTATTFNPVEYRYYDKSGRLVASRDANGNLTTLTLLAGSGYGGAEASVTTTTTEDAAVYTTGYDIHGDARRVIDQIGRVREQEFDRRGRLIRVEQPSGLEETYKYDGLGQRIRSWNSVLGSSKGERNFYDQQGRIIKHVNMGGDETTYLHEWDSTLATALGTSGGWLQTTTYDNSKTLVEKNDLFGRMIHKVDLGGHETFYTYDNAGRLSKRDGAPSDPEALGVNYAYLDTGRLEAVFTDVWDPTDVDDQRRLYLERYPDALLRGFIQMNGGNQNSDSDLDLYDYAYRHYQEFGGTNPANLVSQRKTTYVYDKAGNVVSEKYVDIGLFPSPTAANYYSNATATYDALGRLISWDEAGSDQTPAALLDYVYDANGNIRRSTSVFRTINAQGVASSSATQDYWYAFDALNRVVTAKGDLVGESIVRGMEGIDLQYDAAGQRRYSFTSFVDQYETVGQVFDPELNEWVEGTVWEDFTNVRRERYVYDSGGRLDEVWIGTGTSDGAGGIETTPQDAGSPGATNPDVLRATFDYDLMGRLTLQRDYANGVKVFERQLDYNDNSQLTQDETYTFRGGDAYTTVTDYDYRDEYTDYALGSPVIVHSVAKKNGSTQSDTTTNYTYNWWDGPMQAAIAQGSISSQYEYQNVGGSPELYSVQVLDGRPHHVIFRSDLNGQIIRRDEADRREASSGSVTSRGDPHEVYYRFNGKELGYSGNNGTLESSYADSIASRTAAPSTQGGAFRNDYDQGKVYFDFDQSIGSISSYDQGSMGGSYTVREGDTLSSIASMLWGDSNLWYKLAEANGLAGEVALFEGQVLVLPTGVVKNTHNASTFSPYEASEVIGDTGPSVPRGKKKNKCGGIGMVLLAVVAVVVTVWTGGAAAGAFGAIANGAGFSGIMAGAAAGGSAALGGASLGVAAGLGAGAAVSGASAVLTTVGGIAAGAIGGAVGSIVSQGVGVMTGIQEKFSWNAVALAAIGGAIGGSGSKLGVGGKSWVASGLRGMVANAATQGVGKALGLQDKFSWAGVAAAGVSAGVGHSVGDALKLNTYATTSSQYFVRNALTGAARAIAAGASRSLIEGSDFGDNVRASLPDVIGQTIGDAIAGGLSYSREPEGSWDGEDPKPYGSLGKAGEEPIDVWGQRPERRGILEQIWGGIEFAAGVGVGFLEDTVRGVLSVGDYFISDMGGSAFYWINEGIDAIVPGDLPNGYEQSWIDYQNANNIIGGLTMRALSDPGGLVSAIGAEFSRGVTDSNNRATAFERGRTNPWGKLITGVATLPYVASRAGALTGLNRLGQAGRAGAGAEAVQGMRAADAAADAARVSGETAATATGREVHAALAAERQASGAFDLVNTAIKGPDGAAIAAAAGRHVPTSGATITVTPGRTTTVIGSYPSDMKYILREYAVPQLDGGISDVVAGFSKPNPGGLNFLNVSDRLFLDAQAIRASTGRGFFAQVNSKWVEAAAARGDRVIVASHRRFMRDDAGQLTGFGKEVRQFIDEHSYQWNSDYTELLAPSR